MASSFNAARVHSIFEGLETGDVAKFMTHVAEDVKWVVTNPDPASKSHPLAGVYESRQAFADSTFKLLSSVLSESLKLVLVAEPIVSGDWAVVELKTQTSDGKVPYGKNGVRFDNRYAWIFRWDPSQSKIVEVRAYPDSAMVKTLLSDSDQS